MSFEIPSYLPAPLELTKTALFLFVFSGYVTRFFTKNLDQDIQESPWFLEQNKWTQLVVKKALDFFHHWPLGWALMLWAARVSALIPFFTVNDIYYVGLAIFLDDLPDVPRRYTEMLKTYSVFGGLPNTPAPSPPLETPVSIVQVGQYTPSAPLTPTPELAGTGISSSPESPG